MTADVPEGRDRVALRGLRRAFERVGYTAERVEERLGTQELSSRPIDTAVHLRRLDGSDGFSTFARLFLLGDEVPVERVEEAVGDLDPERLSALGLVSRMDGTMRALVRLVPHGDYYVASDVGSEAGTEVPFDHVPGIQAPSVTLAKLAVRRHCARTLDLGTGCGIQALLAAKHSEWVVATDVNPRALAFAAFNAALNGVEGIEFRLGDGFAPVQGESFDLIVSNPPYVISPDASYAYRDSGLPADELCRRVVQAAAAHLNEGGFAHVLVSWAHTADGDWAEPLRGWVEGSGCDAWLLHYRTSDPVAHAAGWLRPLGESDLESYVESLDRWLEYLHRLRIDAIGYGAVVLRRRGGGRQLDTYRPAAARAARAGRGTYAARVRGTGRPRTDGRRRTAGACDRTNQEPPAPTDAHRPGRVSWSRARHSNFWRGCASPSASTATPSRYCRTSTAIAHSVRSST